MPRVSGYDQTDGVPVYILAGGRSSRFGSDKARVPVAGKPLISHIADVLSPLKGPITVVARRAGEYDDLGLRTIGDVAANRGPMGGVLTALEDGIRWGWVFVTACDWLGLRVEWVHELRHHAHSPVQAVVFRSDRFEPLFGFYHVTIVETCRRLLSQEVRSMQELLSSARIVSIPSPFLQAGVVNMNDPSQHRS